MGRATVDYIPRPDADFSAWAANYYQAVKTWWKNQGLDENELTPLSNALGVWLDAYPAHVSAQAAAESARQEKDAARAGLQAQVRPITNFIQSFGKTSDADRAAMGITVRDQSRTPAPTPTSRPLVSAAPTGRLTQELRLADEHSPTSRARPRGAAGAEVWAALVPPNQPAPTSPDQLRFLTLATKPVLRTSFRPEDGGKTAVYMLRWVNTRGEKGPWSEVCTATVAA